MANQPFDQTIINALERPTSSDLNQAQGQAHADVRMLASKLFQKAVGASVGQEGFVGDSFKVVPTSPASLNVVITNGIGFQNGSNETDIGGINGLTDAFTYKAMTISNRTIPAVAPPTTAGRKRYDLIQVRVPFGNERLTNAQSKDIYNPALNTFNATSVYKTLSSDLTSADIETIPYNGTPSGNYQIVYKTGEEFAISALYPTADAGYLPIAYVYSQNGVATITGIKDVRVVLGATPNFVVGFQGGTTSVTTTGWTQFSNLGVALNFRAGLVRIRIQPWSTGASGLLTAINPTGLSKSVYVKFRVEGPITREFVFQHIIPVDAVPENHTIPLPVIEDYFPEGEYAVTFWAKCDSTNMIVSATDLVLFVAQG